MAPERNKAGKTASQKKVWQREPQVLLLPTVPEPLHQVCPRNLLGASWWNAERKRAYESTDHHCLACGVHKSEALFKQWMEAHEHYRTDYQAGLLHYERAVPLCNACHSFIHQGRLTWLLKTQQITMKRYTMVQRHGARVLHEAGLSFLDKVEGDVNLVPAEEWRLVLEGKMYCRIDLEEVRNNRKSK